MVTAPIHLLSPSLYPASFLKSWMTILPRNTYNLFWPKGQEGPSYWSNLISLIYRKKSKVTVVSAEGFTTNYVWAGSKSDSRSWLTGILPSISQHCLLILFYDVLFLTVSWLCMLFLLKIFNLFMCKDHILCIFCPLKATCDFPCSFWLMWRGVWHHSWNVILESLIKKNKIFSLSNQMFTSSKRSFLLSISFAFQSLENLIMAFDACYNMDEPWKYYTNWNKPDIKG